LLVRRKRYRWIFGMETTRSKKSGTIRCLWRV
jgi:hypothetical protein